MIQTGTHGPYKWLETDHDLREFLSLCFVAVAGKHVAITAVDGGSFVPSEGDYAAGWTDEGGIAYSPPVESPETLPPNCCCRDCCGSDEWYIFRTAPKPLGSICDANIFETALTFPNVFRLINFPAFRVSDPTINGLSYLFWAQMAWVCPESYVGDGFECFIFASSDHELFDIVHDALSRSPSENTDPEFEL